MIKFTAVTDFLAFGIGTFEKGKVYEVDDKHWDDVKMFAMRIEEEKPVEVKKPPKKTSKVIDIQPTEDIETLDV